MKRGRVIADYLSPYPHPLVAEAGTVFSLGRSDEEWPGWIWCTHASGAGAWVPAAWLQIEGETGTLRADYTSAELSVKAGEELALYDLESGWYWAANSAGQRGWVPERNVTIIE